MVRQPVEPGREPMPGGSGRIGLGTWLWEEAKDHLFPWGPSFLRQRAAVQAAGTGLAIVVTTTWVLAATRHIGYAVVIAWWTGWSVYEVLCRRRCKPWIKVGPWWGRERRPAGTADIIFYVATRNLLIGAVLFLVLALLGLGAAAAVAGVWTVRPGESIAAAVQRARPGDTVVVERGDYAERLVIDKPLTLRGRGRPTLSGEGFGDVIRVRSPDVAIEGLIVRDSGADLTAQNAGIYIEPGAHRAVVRDNDIVYTLFGLWIEGANDVLIERNLITGLRDVQSAQRGNGIQLYDTRRARILDNRVSFTRDGIYVDVSHDAVFRGNRMHHLRYGTHYMNSYRNLWERNESYLNRSGLALMEVRDQVVRHNVAWGNQEHGIMLRTIQDSLIEGNVVARNGKGFFVYDAEYNVLKHNLVVGNRIGIHLWAGSYRNDVDGNDFIANQEQVRYVASRDQSWGAREGNYWSNYAGFDRDGDGRGDLPYVANDVVDRLVWRYPYVKLMLHSPAVQALGLAARQFPLLRAPSVTDPRPRMRPRHPHWSRWLEAGR